MMVAEPMPFDEARVARKMLATLFGSKSPDTYIVLFQVNPARSTSFQTVDAAAAHAAGLSDIWVHMGLTRRPFTLGERPSAGQIDGLCGFGADIDIANPVHKKPGLPRTRDEAMSIIQAIGLPYGLLIDSGHGLQPWFVFGGEPWMFEDQAERRRAQVLLRAFGLTVRERAKALGHTIDMVFDLPRLLRLAGTVNAKSDPVPVTILKQTGATVTVEDIEAVLLDGTWEQAEREIDGRSASGSEVVYGELTLDPKAEPPWTKFDLLRDLEPRFDQAWRRKRTKRTEDWSPSEWDQSLASYAAQAGWSRQEIADLLIAGRAKHGEDLKLRQDYFAATINKATASQVDVEAIREAVAASVELASAPPDERPDTERTDILTRLSAAISVQIDRILRSRSEPPIFSVETPYGTGQIGGIESIVSNRKFRLKVAELTNRIPRKFKDDTWDPLAQAMLQVAEVEDLGAESTLAGKAETLISLYLGNSYATPIGEMPEKALAVLPIRLDPFIGEDGDVRIFASGFRAWLAEYQHEDMTRPEIGTMLRTLGATPETRHFRISGRRTTRTLWRVPGKDATTNKGVDG